LPGHPDVFTWIDIAQSPLNLVGVSLLTKTVFQPLKMQRLYRPLPEQARSHWRGPCVDVLPGHPYGFTCIDIERSPLNFVGLSLLTKTVFQPLKMQRLY
jgi:hypothetical protein